VKASREGMSHVQLKHFEWAKGLPYPRLHMSKLI